MGLAPAMLAATLFLGACEGRSLPLLRLAGLSPAQGDDDAAVAVEIAGEGFLPRARTDFDDPSQSAMNEGFSATLVPAEAGLPEAPLVEVRRLSSRALAATVPAGLARGFYGIRVTDPFGNEATLPEVYRVVRSSRSLAAFKVTRLGSQRASVPFMLEVEAVDGSGERVDGFAGAVGLQDRTGALTPTLLGPFTLGRARAQVLIAAIIGSDAIEVSDGLGHSGRSNDFVVLPGTPAQLALTGIAPVLEAGACSGRVEVRLQDSFAQPAPSPVPLAVTLEAAPAERFTLFADDACTQGSDGLAVPANATSVAFSFRARRAGTLLLRAETPGLPSTTQPLEVTPLAASRLDFVTPSQILATGTCSAAVEVGLFDHYGNAVAPVSDIEVVLTSQPSAALAFFSDSQCSVLAPGLTLTPAAARQRFWARGATAGSAGVQAAAHGSPTLSPGVLPLTVTP